ncbi:UDP-N-acetylmuramoyl-tripeptide--D-alanyl-D-alanine ligase [Candidatus Dependentiae bacterium]|nr:UDP-N-acetylmuramoyl-tripeptide--D-alanyl-D-alanine ligase [Candidatus Dependentiae bacterium]
MIISDFIRSVLPTSSFLYAPLQADATWAIDSRTIQKGDIFVAIRGNNLDGHHFVADAFSRGAAGCMIEKNQESLLSKIDKAILKEKTVIIVDNTQQALARLAVAVRQKFSGPVIGITGSIGKTSTKEAIASILKANNQPYLASTGTQNTVLGISLTLLKLRAEHQVIVLELGISKRGEMARLVEIAQPTIGLITAVGHSHMEGLGSIIDIANEKRDIFKYFKEDNIGIINGDQPLLANVAYNHPVIKFGSKTTNQVQARKVQATSDSLNFTLKLYGQKYKITLPTNHKGAVLHWLAAASIAYLIGIDNQMIVDCMQKPVVVPGRFERRRLKLGNGIIINDCYNASPESMKAALTAFQHVQTSGHKIAILGDMLELGVNSPFWHRQIGRFLRKVPTVRDLILVGSHIEWTKKTLPLGVKVEVVPTWKEASQKLKERLSQEVCILVKASRGIALNNLVDEFSL